MKTIDLRSDTVTKPTKEMYEASLVAEIGDDIYGDDETVIKLEALAAEILGKEAGLFVTSGTMGNLIALLSQTNRGDEIILSKNSHILTHEVGGVASIANLMCATIDNPNDFIYANDVLKAIRSEDIHHPTTKLVCMENALGNGRVVPLSILKEVYEVSKTNNLKVHLDGARIFNAALSLNVEAKEIAQYADTIMFCLSKGLCAPIGSMLVGDQNTINKARKIRKILGGGIRQGGIIASYGIVSLESMIDRLKEDHDNAKYLAEKLTDLGVFTVFEEQLDINLVWCRYALDPKPLEVFLKSHHIKFNESNKNIFRFVTHKDLTREDIDNFINLIKDFLAKN